MAKKRPDFSIIILNYNTEDLLRICLKSVKKAKTNGFKFETVVVDNGSIDDSVKMVKKEFPWAELVTNKKNLGFTKGNNVGMKKSSGRYILLLNSDTKVLSNTFVEMIKFMDKNSKAGLATCRVELGDGTLDPACHRGFPTPWASLTYMLGLEGLFPQSKLFGQYHQTYKNLAKSHQIDSPTGAFSLVRRKVAEEVGFLDEDYFMYGEDLDWAYRIKKAGWQVWYYPKVKIVHYKKQSGLEKGDGKKINQRIKKVRRETVNHFYNAMKIFYQKHYFDKYPRILTNLVMLGVEFKRRFTLLQI